MNLDLPPSSAFTPDPAVARAGHGRGSLTLTMPQPTASRGPEPMSGSIRVVPGSLPVGPCDVSVFWGTVEGLTITF